MYQNLCVDQSLYSTTRDSGVLLRSIIHHIKIIYFMYSLTGYCLVDVVTLWTVYKMSFESQWLSLGFRLL